MGRGLDALTMSPFAHQLRGEMISAVAGATAATIVAGAGAAVVTGSPLVSRVEGLMMSGMGYSEQNSMTITTPPEPAPPETLVALLDAQPPPPPPP